MIGDKYITIKGKEYELAGSRDARTWVDKNRLVWNNMEEVRRKAQKWGGKDSKVRKIHNTHSFAVYIPVKYKSGNWGKKRRAK
jgi:hypothetical protein